jgi:hypothetical protein
MQQLEYWPEGPSMPSVHNRNTVVNAENPTHCRLAFIKRLFVAMVLCLALCELYAFGLISNRIRSIYFVPATLLISVAVFRKESSLELMKAALLVFSSSVALASLDLALRPLIRNKLYYGPPEMFMYAWPPMTS